MIDGDRPYRLLGWHLKLAREQLTESVTEVSGAVEIDPDFLEKIEQGKARPSEDVLMLLISHFTLEDAEANSLWELAGYANKDETYPDNTADNVDLRVIYTDLVHVVVNDFGVVMNFLQTGGINNQSMLVSRVGMSKDQARHLLKVLQQNLDETNKTHKVLPSQTNSSKSAKPQSNKKD